MIVYDDALSADSYVVRLVASMLGLTPEVRARDSLANPERSPSLFDDGGISLRNPVEILRHLAQTYDETGRWYPSGQPAHGEVEAWLAASARLDATAGEARRRLSDAVDFDVASHVVTAHRILRSLDEHLWFSDDQGSGWLASAAHPTIADIAWFPHVMLAPEGEVSLLEYPALRRWAERVKKIPGFITMPGIFPAFLPPEVGANGDA